MDFGTLHTLKSPSRVCTASISEVCFEEDACHARPTIGEGEIDVVVSVCRIVNEGDRAAIKTDPLLYLYEERSDIAN